MTKKEVFKKIKEQRSSIDLASMLDDDVHQIKSLEASKINNAGISAQLDYLFQEHGLDWLIKGFLN